MTQRYKITVEYDGTDLLGWQKQLDGSSAQEFLEKAVEAFCQEKTEVYGAGRTDAGVHALAQIAHFDLNREVDPFRLREAVNAHLRSMEAPVSVLAAEKTAPDFHARYSAVGRAYTEARSFLHHQVRNMVGTLKMVGDGHLAPEEIKTILEARDRRAAGPTAPACGLYLSKIMYRS